MRFSGLILLACLYCSATAASMLTIEEAHHLLTRTGFGASPHELTQLTRMNRKQAVDHITDNLRHTPLQPYPEWTRDYAPHHFIRNELTQVQRRQFNEARDNEIRLLRQWWVREMIETSSPQTERLVLFWHDHFATGYSGINDQAIAIARQHKTIRKHASGNFRAFLKDIIRDPAMLNYLDNDNSKKSAPNENLARELLELFTLGEGHYQEADIKNIARALTGYRINRIANLQFEFKPSQHDNGRKTVFGKAGKFDGDDVIDLILQQPDTARFISGKFWRFLVSDSAPPEAVAQHLASTFSGADYDIKTLYREILHSDEFWAPENRASLIRSPTALTIGTIRATGRVPANWQVIPAQLAQLGQRLFDPPNVAGWPGGKAWVTPSRLLNRLEWLKRFPQGCHDCNTAMSMENTMQNTNAMMASSSMASTAASEETLVLHMASEEYDEPVRYRVILMADDTLLWSSGERTLQGGHDTRRFGRINGQAALPWRDVLLPVPAHAHKFDAIELEYINDKHAPGVARNLYVKHASFQAKHYPADAGQQTNDCPKVARAKGGVMLCNGTLRLQASTAAAPPALAPGDESGNDSVPGSGGGLQATGLYPRSAQPVHMDRPRSAISYSMTDVTLDERTWHTLAFSYLNITKNSRYQLIIHSNECWPNCFITWPVCDSNARSPQRWALDINKDYRQQCVYRTLQPADQKLIDTLIHRAPDIHQHAASGKRLRKIGFSNNFNAWSPHIEKIAQLAKPPNPLPNTRPNTQSISIKPLSASPVMMSTSAPRTQPHVAGRSAQQFQSDLQLLNEQHQVADFSDLLLPGVQLPGNGDVADLSAGTLTDTLTHLAYQLH